MYNIRVTCNKLTNQQVANNVELYNCGTCLERRLSIHVRSLRMYIIVRYLEGCIIFIINPNYIT